MLRAQTDYAFGDPPPAPPEQEAIAVRTAPFAAGTLQVFAGRYSLHAVTPVYGAPERLVAVLCFAGEAGVRNSPSVQQMFWGRTA